MSTPSLLASPAPELVEVEHPDRRARDIVNRLLQTDLFRGFRQSFESITDLPLALQPAGSFRPALDGAKLASPLYSHLAASSHTCAALLRDQEALEAEAASGPGTIESFAGLSASAVPIRTGDQVVGYLHTGHVVVGKPSRASLKRLAARVAKLDADADRSALEAAYFQTKAVARRQYESAVQLLAIFAQQLSAAVNQAMVTEAAAEPPAIARSRAYISDHLSEELSLAEVARAANMSAFYFCKMFKRSTGVTFTDYVARVRVEGVKSLLLKPHVRVSEAAFEVGFQSLSQFNRVFRRVVGESPSDYRDRLHRSALPATAGRATAAFAAA